MNWQSSSSHLCTTDFRLTEAGELNELNELKFV